MGANNGTGYPNWLKCWRCRREITGRFLRSIDRLPGDCEAGTHLIATGRTKPLRTHHIGIRSTKRQIEYRCLDCGHVGWTKHMDAERLLARVTHDNAPATATG